MDNMFVKQKYLPRNCPARDNMFVKAQKIHARIVP
jgi:hypothetical protein